MKCPVGDQTCPDVRAKSGDNIKRLAVALKQERLPGDLIQQAGLAFRSALTFFLRWRICQPAAVLASPVRPVSSQESRCFPVAIRRPDVGIFDETQDEKL